MSESTNCCHFHNTGGGSAFECSSDDGPLSPHFECLYCHGHSQVGHNQHAPVIDTPLEGITATVLSKTPPGYRFQFGWNGYKFYAHPTNTNLRTIAVRG